VNSRQRLILLLAGVLMVAGGAVLWVAFASDVATSWGQSVDELPYGRDLRSFTAAGEIAAQRNVEQLYDPKAAPYVEVGAATFVNPPWYAMVMIPFSLVPFGALYVMWSLAGVLALWWSYGRLDVPIRDRVVALTLMSMAAAFAMYFGQNTFFMVAILAFGVLALERDDPVVSGVAIALLAFKPHLLVGIGVWWLADLGHRWKAIMAAAVTTGMLAIVSALWLPGSWQAFFDALGEPESLVDVDVEATLLSAVRLLMGSAGAVAVVVFGVLAIGIVIGLVLIVRRTGGSVRVTGAVAIVVSILIAFHGLPYDWLLLVVAGGLLVREKGFGPERVAVAGIVLGFALVAGDYLTEFQLDRMPIAVHIAPWVLLSVTIWIMRTAWLAADPRPMTVRTS
jgi:hypothetical protein